MSAEARAYARAVGVLGSIVERLCVTHEVDREARREVEECFRALGFDEPEEAIEIANGTDYGLVAGVYTRDLETAHWTADRLSAGQVFVNEWFAGGVETPFGGTKRSGFGREKGQEALLNYVQTKNVAVKLGGGAGGRPGG